jgi:hypothetical protein
MAFNPYITPQQREARKKLLAKISQDRADEARFRKGVTHWEDVVDWRATAEDLTWARDMVARVHDEETD